MLLCLLALAAGCSANRPYAAAKLHLSDDEQGQNLVLDDSDRAEIRRAFAALVAEHEPVSPPAPAAPGASGVRWSDVQLAAYYAAMDVEMAIMRTQRSPGQLHFTLRSASERTGELIVRQVDDERVYLAQATVGMFRDDHETAQRLLDAFDRRMRNFGRKRALAD